jgi:hypothetical protein
MSVTDAAEERKPVLEAALEYARRGWPVLPIYSAAGGLCSCSKQGSCDAPGKHPRTKNGLKDASVDEQLIRTWLTETPDANIAVVTGAPSGAWVLDVDGPDAKQLLERLASAYGSLPPTPVVRTHRGQHYYFHWRDETPISSRAHLHGLPLDTRGKGGYVVLPPSRHASGGVYAWEVSPTDAGVADAPGWLIDFVTDKCAAKMLEVVADQHPAVRTSTPGDGRDAPRGAGDQRPAAGSGVAAGPASEVGAARRHVFRVEEDLDLATAEGVPEGSRHARALELVGAHLGRGEDPEQVLELAVAWAARCDPPPPENEVRRIVSDLAAKQETAAGGEATDWPPPVPFSDIDLPKFPTEALPAWARTFVEADAIATQTPPDLAAMLHLSASATALAKKVEVLVKEGYCEPVNLYTVTVLPPANRKSAVFADVAQPIVAYEREAADELKPQMAEVETLRDIDEARLTRLKTAAGKAKVEEREGIIKEVAALSRALATSGVPAVPRLLADDSTPEKLASLLHENEGRMAVLSPEGDVFELMAGRYSTTAMPNLNVYLKGHAGDDIRVDRVNRPPEFIHRPALTFGLAVQPDVLHGLADKPGFRGRGLLGRFLYSLPQSLVGHRDVDPPPVPSLVRAAYREGILNLLRLPYGKDDAGQQAPHFLRLSEEARGALLALASWLEPQLAPGGPLGAISDWAGKLAGATARIAGLLHVADHIDSPEPWAVPISGAVMGRAVQIARYLIPHAQAAFAEMGADPMVEDAKYVLAWVVRHGVQSFTERDLFEGTKGRFKRVEALRPVLGLLANHAFVRQRPAQGHLGPGRPPSPVYDVNPLAHSQYSHNSQNSALTDNSANCANSAKPPGPLGSGECVNRAAPTEYEEGSL